MIQRIPEAESTVQLLCAASEMCKPTQRACLEGFSARLRGVPHKPPGASFMWHKIPVQIWSLSCRSLIQHDRGSSTTGPIRHQAHSFYLREVGSTCRSVSPLCLPVRNPTGNTRRNQMQEIRPILQQLRGNCRMQPISCWAPLRSSGEECCREAGPFGPQTTRPHRPRPQVGGRRNRRSPW